MKNARTYKIALGYMLILFCYPMFGQNLETYNSYNPDAYETDKRAANYQKLSSLGYKEREIFEDLGNAGFLAKNYETAIYWYKRLITLDENGVLPASYYERYQFALEKTGKTAVTKISEDKDWVAIIREDYQINNKPTETRLNPTMNSKYHDFGFRSNNNSASLDLVVHTTPPDNDFEAMMDKNLNYKNAYKTPMSVTADGNTAYFTKAIYVKPVTGIFSKKELVHKIYKAENINGQWKNIEEVALCPKNFSTVHPTISDDGKRLFFASDMPGTFGKYDIYVAAVYNDGTYGVAKNLGEKVNTNKNDLYPNIVGGTSLFFASDGHKGQGGLDVFLVQVNHKKVGWSVNLGGPINSEADDFSIALIADKGKGYVISNRGNNKTAVQRVAFSYSNTRNNSAFDKKEYNFLEAFNNDLKIDYSTAAFED